jgi:serine protease Do
MAVNPGSTGPVPPCDPARQGQNAVSGSGRPVTPMSLVSRLCLLLLTCLLAVPAQGQRGGMTDVLQRRNEQQWREAFRPVVAAARQSVVMVRCERRETILGTIVDADGWIVTKASELWSTDLTVRLPGGREVPARLHGRDEDHDLALIKADADGLTPIVWSQANLQLGQFLATAGMGELPLATGVLSVGVRAIPTRGGMLGVQLEDDPRGPRVAVVVDGSEAAKAGLLAGDIIVSLGGLPTPNRDELLAVLNQRPIGSAFAVVVLRGGRQVELQATLGRRPTTEPSRNDMMNQMGGPLSYRGSGFPEVFQHDTILRPIDCGSPVLDLDGRAVGINIARAGRTETFALPAAVVQKVVARLIPTARPRE